MHTLKILTPCLLSLSLCACLSGESTEQVELNPTSMDQSSTADASMDMNTDVEDMPTNVEDMQQMCSLNCSSESFKQCVMTSSGPTCECQPGYVKVGVNDAFMCVEGNSCDATEMARCGDVGQCVRILNPRGEYKAECFCGPMFVGFEDGWNGSKCKVEQCRVGSMSQDCLPKCKDYQKCSSQQACFFTPEDDPVCM